MTSILLYDITTRQSVLLLLLSTGSFHCKQSEAGKSHEHSRTDFLYFWQDFSGNKNGFYKESKILPETYDLFVSWQSVNH